MKKRTVPAFAFVLAFISILSGCGKKEEIRWTPDRTTLQVNEDGTITETVMDTLNQNYYHADELSKMISDSIDAYNSEHGNNAVTEASFTTDQGRIELIMNYAAPEDYASYNNVSFYAGTMLGAQMAGYRFDSSFRKVTDGKASGKEISYEEPLSHKEDKVVVTDFSHAVTVPGEITYISAGAEMADTHTALPETIQKDSSASEESENTFFYVIYQN